MLENIESVLQDQCSLQKNRPIVVGVSGGPDSLCLMEALRQAGYSIFVAHYNHHLRPEADGDATAVEQTASRLMIPSVVDGGDVRAYADEQGMSIEEAARHLRYKFLFDYAKRHGAQAVAVGHTADDQVETVLMHFLRGTGLTGLKGMSYRTILPAFSAEIPIVRPLLDVWREETVIYCAANGLRPRYDPSNDAVNFTRNRLRNLLIPTLETYNPKFREAVWRSVQSLKGDHALLLETLDNAWNECVGTEASGLVVFDSAQLSMYSVGLQRNLIRRAIETLHPGQETTYAILERAARFLNDLSATRTDLAGGLSLFREGGNIYLATPEGNLPFDKWPQMREDSLEVTVAVPGQVDLSGGWRMNCERWRLPALARDQSERNEDPLQIWLDADTLPLPLELRVRHAGDRFEPLGMEGHSQKLSDFFINQKVPLRARDRWPLLCSGDTVIWVPGYRPAHPYRLTDHSHEIFYFAVTRPPEKIVPEETNQP